MNRQDFNDDQVEAIRARVAKDFELYCRWLRRLERRHFEPNDVFLLGVRRVKRAPAALDSVSKLGLGQRRLCQMFTDDDQRRSSAG